MEKKDEQLLDEFDRRLLSSPEEGNADAVHEPTQTLVQDEINAIHHGGKKMAHVRAKTLREKNLKSDFILCCGFCSREFAANKWNIRMLRKHYEDVHKKVASQKEIQSTFLSRLAKSTARVGDKEASLTPAGEWLLAKYEDKNQKDFETGMQLAVHWGVDSDVKFRVFTVSQDGTATFERTLGEGAKIIDIMGLVAMRGVGKGSHFFYLEIVPEGEHT